MKTLYSTFLINNFLKVFCLLVFLLVGEEVRGTHHIGTDLTYVCIAPNQYRVNLVLYRDCGGITLSNPQTISWTGSCAVPLSGSASVFRTSITNLALPGVANCSGTSSLSCIEKHVYTGVVTIPSAGCTGISFMHTMCCRNNILTVINPPPGGANTTVRSYVKSSLVPCNNSPTFNGNPIFNSCMNQPVHYNPNVVEADGDSLVYSLINCLNDAGTGSMNYSPGFSGTSFLGPSVPISMNPATGDLTFTPSLPYLAFSTIICIRVDEYRNGVHIGFIQRDFNYTAWNCSNSPPISSGINGTNNDTITLCYGNNFCFNVQFVDTNGHFMTMGRSTSIQNATFTSTSANDTIVGTFCWSPTIFDVGTHYVQIYAYDNCAPINGQTFHTYTINVVNSPYNINVGPDITICNGDSATLTLTTLNTNISSISWSPAYGLSSLNAATILASPASVTTYAVTANFYAGNYCTAIDYITVTVHPRPPLTIQNPTITLYNGGTINLYASSQPGVLFDWVEINTGTPLQDTTISGTSIVGVTVSAAVDTHYYRVTVTDPTTLCSSTGIITVYVLQGHNKVCEPLYVTTTGLSTALGTKADPLSLEQAVIQANGQKITIKIAQGIYNINNSLQIPSDITLEGGFDAANNWSKTSQAGATIIHRTTANPAGTINVNQHLTALEIFGSQNFRLQDLTITTANANIDGMSTYGIYMLNASNYNITRVQVQPGNARNGKNGVNGCSGSIGDPGTDGATGLTNTVNNNRAGGNGGFPGNTCSSGVFIPPGGGGNSGNGGNGGNGADASAGISDGGAGGGGGRGGPAIAGGNGGVSGRGGTLFAPPFGCSATIFGLGGNVSGGNGGVVNNLNGVPSAAVRGMNGTTGISGVNGCNGSIGTTGTHTGTRFQAGGQGARGMEGSGGSGGGGGGGGGGQGPACGCVTGTGNGGGGGGGGGAGGEGGFGGFGGGASFGIYAANNGANGSIKDCYILPGAKGLGGIGGTGGTGGLGGNGGLGGTTGITEVGAGGNGGNGGNGGIGGAGGNGRDGIALKIYWSGVAPVRLDTAFNLAAQPVIEASEAACSHQTIQFLAPGLPNGMGTTSWDFDILTNHATIPTGLNNPHTTTYDSIGRYSISHAGAIYTDFYEVLGQAVPVNQISSTAAMIAPDTFQLCVGDVATFSAASYADSAVWNFNGAITNPINQLTTLAVPFNTAGFYPISLAVFSNCCSVAGKDTVYLWVKNTPSVLSISNATICQGDTALITVSGLAAGDTVTWLNTGLYVLNDSTFWANPTDTTAYTGFSYGNGSIPTCVATINTNITVNTITATLTASSPHCVANVGSIAANVSAGTGTYLYQWSNGVNHAITSANDTIKNLSNGIYFITITDQNTGCFWQSSEIINISTLNVTSQMVQNPNCFGDSTGIATAFVTTGAAPFQYLWSSGSGAISNLPNHTAMDLPAGVNCVDIIDLNGCLATTCITVSEPSALNFISINPTNPICNGNPTGAIQANVSGGTGSYLYLWNTGDTTLIGNLTNLDTGLYIIIILDSNLCQLSDTVALTSTDMLANLSANAVNCFGDSTTITISVTGGLGNYTYTWQGGNSASFSTNQNVVTGALAANYDVTITDASGCNTNSSINITQPTNLAINLLGTNPICNGNPTGAIQANVSGGTGSYLYLWNTGDTTLIGNLTNLDTGLYIITILDSNLCQLSGTVALTSTDMLANLSANAMNCFGDSTTITISVTGGLGNYTYTWQGGNSASFPTNQNVVTGVLAGNYDLTVTDASGCNTITSINIIEPPILLATITNSSDASVLLPPNGSATAQGQGGTGSYSYDWGSNAANQNTATATGLAPDIYCVSITDSMGCVDTTCVEISLFSDLNVATQNSMTMVLYPNPTNHSINLECTNIEGEKMIAIYDAIGQLVHVQILQDNQITILVQNWASGVYWLQLKTERGAVLGKRFIIEN